MTDFKAIVSNMLEAYARAEKLNTSGITEELNAAFDKEGGLMEKVREMDSVFDRHKDFEELRELSFDLLMIRFLALDSRKLDENYLESPEWAKIEEKTLDRGTEALNIFLYLTEAADMDVPPSLDDFLNEFLLVDDDLYQDEIEIYEPIIKNHELVDAEPEELVKADAEIADGEMKEIFLPLMLYFMDVDDKVKENTILSHSKTPGMHLAILKAIEGFGK